MIAQTPKPIEEILEYLEGKEKVVLVGCGGCATVFHTGGEPELEETAKKLAEKGKKVLAAIVAPLGNFTCYAPWIKKCLSKYKEQIQECDAIVILACGDGLQVVKELVLEEGFEIIKPIYPGANAIGLMGGGPTLFKEKCQQCGECELGKFAGICPLTQCSKGLLNGPCGGYENGKCEVDPERDCAWVKIYEDFRALGILEKMKEIIGPKDRSKMTRPREIEVARLVIKQQDLAHDVGND